MHNKTSNMTRATFSEKVVEPRIKAIRAVLAKKAVEYSQGIDPGSESAFHNFYEAAGLSFHETGLAVGWEFMVKHLQSIKDLIDVNKKTGKLPSQALLSEKIGDAVNYLILIEGMFLDQILSVDEKTCPTVVDYQELKTAWEKDRHNFKGTPVISEPSDRMRFSSQSVEDKNK